LYTANQYSYTLFLLSKSSSATFLYNDPGLTNILYIHLRDGNGILLGTRVLTRTRYYECAKINAAVAQSNRWNTSPVLAKVIIGLSENHFKHASLTEFERAIENYCDNFEQIWSLESGTKKWSCQNF
jgi:hypothetical protein